MRKALQEDHYRTILEEALPFAQYDARIPTYLTEMGDFFRVPTRTRELAIEWVPEDVEAAIQVAIDRGYEHRTVEEVIASFTPIIRDAVQHALVNVTHKDKHVFADVILQLARKGKTLDDLN